MKLMLTIRVALRALRKNKLRAGLTVLGVVIGVAAVTTTVSVGQSVTNLVHGELQGLGTNVIIVVPGSSRGHGVRHGRGSKHTLTAGDCDAMVRECPSVLAASPIVFAGGQVIYGNTNWSPREMHGVGIDYLTVRNWELRRGGFFTDRDIGAAAKVCVIGQTIVEKLFQTTNPLGETIRIRNIPFRIIGILKSKGANMVGDDQDNIILAPYTTIRKRLRGSAFDNVDIIFASARSTDQMSEAKHDIRQLLFERHEIQPGDPLDFEVQTTTEIAKMLGMITGTLTTFLASIAAISLLVGGVGIMNIMLVSVTERTREIGIRMAVGARGRDILRQFLVESVLLSVFGGIVGLGLGVGASAGITAIINAWTSGTEWPTVISMKAAALAIFFSGGVGITFGFYPAWRASRLDPIDALRYE
jgi:putative ABC transport system permease protein